MVGKVRGFSLIEVLVVIVILSILMWIAFGPLRNQILRSKLHEAVNTFVADLNEMKRKSLTENVSYGIEITGSNYYQTFVDNDGDCTKDTSEVLGNISLPSGITFSTSNTTRTILWTRKGIPLNSSCGFYSGNITFTTLGFTKTVIISRYGRIRVD